MGNHVNLSFPQNGSDLAPFQLTDRLPRFQRACPSTFLNKFMLMNLGTKVSCKKVGCKEKLENLSARPADLRKKQKNPEHAPDQ